MQPYFIEVGGRLVGVCAFWKGAHPFMWFWWLSRRWLPVLVCVVASQRPLLRQELLPPRACIHTPRPVSRCGLLRAEDSSGAASKFVQDGHLVHTLLNVLDHFLHRKTPLVNGFFLMLAKQIPPKCHEFSLSQEALVMSSRIALPVMSLHEGLAKSQASLPVPDATAMRWKTGAQCLTLIWIAAAGRHFITVMLCVSNSGGTDGSKSSTKTRWPANQ